MNAPTEHAKLEVSKYSNNCGMCYDSRENDNEILSNAQYCYKCMVILFGERWMDDEDDDDHICCECDCKVVLEKYMIVVDGKKYCGVCDPRSTSASDDDNDDDDDHDDSSDADAEIESKPPCYVCESLFTPFRSLRGDAQYATLSPLTTPSLPCGWEGFVNEEKCTKNNMTMDNQGNHYCSSCWEYTYDTCDECYALVVKGQELPPYQSDENNRLQCVCHDCRDEWVKNVAKIREGRMESIKEQRDKLIEFCRKECINEMLLVNNSLEETYNMMYEY